jgi:coenzyme F420-reducing hydrogenase delta subunit
VNAERRVNQAKQLLEAIGLNSERLRMVNISSAMGVQFATIAGEMAEEVTKLGPNPLKEIAAPASSGSKAKKRASRQSKQDGPGK